MTPADELLAFLEEENAALRAGSVQTLAGSAPRKEALAAAFAQTRATVSKETIAALRGAAERNQRLLRAAGEGLRRAVARAQERQRAASHLDTYDASGRRQSHSAGSGRLERRS